MKKSAWGEMLGRRVVQIMSLVKTGMITVNKAQHRSQLNLTVLFLLAVATRPRHKPPVNL